MKVNQGKHEVIMKIIYKQQLWFPWRVYPKIYSKRLKMK